MPRKAKRRGHGQGRVWKQGASWWIGWREKKARRYSKFPDEDTAKKTLAQILANVAAGRCGIPEEPKDEDVSPLGELFAEWMERRKKTHRSAWDDEGRWKLHLAPRFGKMRPDELTPRMIRELVEAELSEGAASASCMLMVRLLSTFYTDLCERGLAKVNPAKGLPRATRRLIRSSHDPKTVPFVERLADVERIYRQLAEPVNLAYAIGAMAGLRTGEILALQWSSVDLERRRIVVSEQVQDGVVMRPKDKDSRVVPILDSLLPVLKSWRLRSGGAGQVVPPMRSDGKRLDQHTLRKRLRTAVEALNKNGGALPRMTWYQATRHTFASQWVLTGGSIEKLREAMGHCSVTVTERYAHLRGDVFTAADLARVAVDFGEKEGKILPLARPELDIDHGLTITSEQRSA